MAITTNIPANWRLPLVWIAVDSSRSGVTPQGAEPALMVGQMNSRTFATGTLTFTANAAATSTLVFSDGASPTPHTTTVTFAASNNSIPTKVTLGTGGTALATTHSRSL